MRWNEMGEEPSPEERASEQEILEAAAKLFVLLCNEAEAINQSSSLANIRSQDFTRSIQFKLGICYEYGFGTDRSLYKAVKYYRAAAQNGYPNGRAKLEHYHKHGFCLWAREDGRTDYDLLYTRLEEDFDPEKKQTEFQVAPTTYI